MGFFFFPPLTSNMTSLSGTKERSVSSRSRKYGVGYSSEWGGHTSVICNVMSDIKCIASSTRWCAVHLAGSLISVSLLRHPWMWSFITDLRPVLTDRVVHASPLSSVIRFHCQNSRMCLLWSTEDGAHAPVSLATSSNYKPHQTHFGFYRSASHCLLVEPVGKYSSPPPPKPAPHQWACSQRLHLPGRKISNFPNPCGTFDVPAWLPVITDFYTQYGLIVFQQWWQHFRFFHK